MTNTKRNYREPYYNRMKQNLFLCDSFNRNLSESYLITKYFLEQNACELKETKQSNKMLRKAVKQDM